LLKKRVAFPKEIQLEITNRCNLDCDMCPRLTLLQVPEIDMSQETFHAILETLQDPESLTLTGWGEPLMHPQFFDFVDQIRQRFPNCEVSFTTNGFLLSEGMVQKILARPFARITLSLEELPWEVGATDHKHAKEAGLDPKKGHNNAFAQSGHPGADIVVTGIRRLVSGRKALNHKTEIRLQAVMVPDGTAVLLKLIDFAADEGLDIVNLVRLDIRGRPDLKRPDWQTERAMIGQARTHAKRAGQAKRSLSIASINDHNSLVKLAAHNDRFCLRLDNYVYIDVNGQVAPCCLLRSHSAGNINEQSLAEIWQSDSLKSFYGPSLPDPCFGCDSFLNGHRDEISKDKLTV
jgi:MoaA/NifB/PqqE/SkfB family radical SAM enzyme